MPSIIKEWDNYQKGITYNRGLPVNFYTLCDTNANFDAGEQYPNAGLDDDFLQPVFNIVNKFTTFFVAYIVSSDVAVKYTSPLKLATDDLSDIVLNASFDEFRERVKFSKKYRQALKDGTITGDYIAHLTFSDKKPYDGAYGDEIGQIDMSLIDATNFYVADPTDREVQPQKYIQYDGRSFVSVLNDEREQFMSDKDSSTIIEDGDTETQIGDFGDEEIQPILSDDGKETGSATWVVTYYKKEETREEPLLDAEGNPELDSDGEPMTKEVTEEWVYSTKCTENTYIWKDRPLGFNVYPCELGNWIEQKNTYHGQTFVKGVVPAQIFINQGFAMAMKHTMDTAFAKFFYDTNVLPEGITADVSTQVGLDLKQGQSVDDAGKYKTPGNMSDKVIAMIDLAYSYIKDVVSLTDAITGNVNPEQASGASIVAASTQAAIPIEVPKLNSHDWVEGIARIYKNMAENLYGERPVLIEEEGEMVLGTYDFAKLKKMYKPPVIEVGDSSYWSENNLIQTLDSMLQAGILDHVEWLEEQPEGKIPNRQKLLKRLKDKAAAVAPVTDAQDDAMPSAQDVLTNIPV